MCDLRARPSAEMHAVDAQTLRALYDFFELCAAV